MRAAREEKSMRGSLNSTMGEPLVARISKVIAGHRELSISPDVLTSGQPARGLLLSDPTVGDIRRLSRSLRLSAWACPPCEPARHREASAEADGQGEAGGSAVNT